MRSIPSHTLALTLVVIAVALTLSFSASAQARLFGTVVDVIDGRTVVLETDAGKTTVQLQFIDVPEPEQALHKTVRDHLKQLLLGKAVEFKALSLTPGKFGGQLTVAGVDISAQMLRDGAAWLVPYHQTGQSKADYDVYQQFEAAAKLEHLGVWSIAGLKPAWELRAEKLAQRRELPMQRARLDITSEFQTIERPGRMRANGANWGSDKEAWLDVFAGTGKESPGLNTYSDPNGRFSTIYTSVAFVNLTSGSFKQRLECRAIYVDYLQVDGNHGQMYLIGFQAMSDDNNFSKRLSRLTITTDRTSVSMPLSKGFRANGSVGVQEIMYYRVTAATLRNIGSALNVQLRIDKLSAPVDKNLQGLVAQLVTATQ